MIFLNPTSRIRPYGATLHIAIPTADYDVELQRSNDNVTFTTVAILKGANMNNRETDYTDSLPSRLAPYYYRARLLRDGYTAGNYSTSVTAYVRILNNDGGATDASPFIDLANPIHANKNLDNLSRSVSDSTTASTVVSRIANTGHLSGSIQDSNSRTINLMFHKTSDDLDDVDDSIATFKRTTVNEKTGAGRGFSTIDSSNLIVAGGLDFSRSYTNKNATYLPRSAGDGTALGTIIQYVQNSGHLGSSIQDSSARTVVGMFHKTSDDIDDIDDSIAVYKRTTGTQVGYTNRAGAGLDTNGDLSRDLISARKVAGMTRTLGDVTLGTVDVPNGGQNMLENPDYIFGPSVDGLDSVALGWGLTQTTIPTWATSRATNNAYSGKWVLVYSLPASTVIAASSTQFIAHSSRRTFRVRGGDTYSLKALVNAQQNVSTPAGIVRATYCFLRVTWTDGTTTDYATPSLGTTSVNWVTLQATVTIGTTKTPDYATFFTIVTVQNTTGAGVSTGAGAIFDVLYDSVELVRVSTADTEVVRSSTNGTSLGNVIARLQDSGHLSGSMQDGNSRTINLMFHKTSDDIDDIDDSIATFKRTTANEKTGAGRGFSALDGSNILTTGVSTSATIAGLGSAGAFARKASATFRDNFDTGVDTAQWNLQAGNNGGPIAATGSTGATVLTSTATSMYYNSNVWIPYDVNKLYRVRVRVRLLSAGTLTPPVQYAGVWGFSSTGTLVSSTWAACVAATPTVADGWVTYTGWVQGTGTDFNPANDPTNPTPMPSTTAFLSPAFALNYPGGSTSNGQTLLDYIQIDEFDADASGRTYRALTGTGKLAQTVQLYDGVRYKNITKGGQESDARHNANVTFSPPFQNTPMIRLSGGVLYEPGSMWGTSGSIDTNNSGSSAFTTTTRVYDDFVPLNQSSTGFTVRARLWQRGTVNARNVDFDGSTATTIGSATTTNALTNAPAGNDSYTLRWKASFTATGVGGHARSATYVFALEADATGTGTWVERNTYSATISDPDGTGPYTDNYTLTDTVSVSGFNGSGKFRLKVKSVSTTGTGTNSVSVTGYVNATDGAYGVSYITTAGDQFASKTPLTSDFIHWQALET